MPLVMPKEAWGDDIGSEAGEGEGGDMSCDILQVSFGKYDSNYYGQLYSRGPWCHCGEPPAMLVRGSGTVRVVSQRQSVQSARWSHSIAEATCTQHCVLKPF